MTLGPETSTERDVQGSGGRRNTAGSGRGRSWPTPILCHDLPFFTRGRSCPSSTNGRAGAIRQGKAEVMGGLTLCTQFLFLNVVWRNILTLLVTHEASGAMPCFPRPDNVALQAAMSRGTRHLPPPLTHDPHWLPRSRAGANQRWMAYLLSVFTYSPTILHCNFHAEKN